MKRLFYILLPLVALMSACKTQAPYITTDTELEFSVSDLMGTQLTVNVTPKDDRAYYYFGLMSSEDYKKWNIADERLMTLMLDSLYREYLNWRSHYLYEDEEYITTFRSHSFHYGKAQRFFYDLNPETDYIIYGFCINPDDIQSPIGKLQKYNIRTTEVQTSVSPMVLDYMVECFDEEEVEGDVTYVPVLISIRPSVNGRPTKEAYMLGILDSTSLHDDFGNDIFTYAKYVANMLITKQVPTDEYVCRDIVYETMYLPKGTVYTLAGAAYRVSFAHALYTASFRVEPGKVYPYRHDAKTDYSE